MPIHRLKAIQTGLVLRARFSGVVTDISVGLRPGLWVSPDQQLLHVADPDGQQVVRGLAYGKGVQRIKDHAQGIFIAESGNMEALPVALVSIGLGGGTGPELSYLSSKNGGLIKVNVAQNGGVRPSQTVYPLHFAVPTKAKLVWLHEQRGTITVEAQAESVAGRFFRYAASVLLRESGF